MNRVKLLIISLIIFLGLIASRDVLAIGQISFSSYSEATGFCNSESINCLGIQFDGEPGVPPMWLVTYECNSATANDDGGKPQSREENDGKVCDY